MTTKLQILSAVNCCKYVRTIIRRNHDKVGVIGVGEMGSKIVKNLERDGFKLVVFDSDANKVREILSPNIVSAETLTEVAKSCKTVLSILPNDAATKSVAMSLLENTLHPICHISCSTVSPTTSRTLASIYSSYQLSSQFVASPVFARPDGLAKRQATWMISGESAGRKIAHEILSKLGNTVDYGDDVGAANVVKLCGNFLIASSIESISECLVLAEKHGVDRKSVIQLLSTTIFDCLIYKGYGQRVSERDHRPGGFSLELGLKDVTLVSQAAREVDAPMPILSTLIDRYVSSKAKGRAAMDWSAIGLAVAEDAGIDISNDLKKNFDYLNQNKKYE